MTWMTLSLLGVSCSQSTEATSDAAAPPLLEDATVFDFSEAQVGVIPAGFTAALTGAGGPGEWQIQQAEGAPSADRVLAQTSDDRTSARYPHIVLKDFNARDVDVSVAFKIISGRVDASGGLVFRYRDPDNYYVIRANALEDNVVAYKTENGRRSNIGVRGEGNAYGVNAAVPPQTWNTLRVITQGPLFEVFLNGQKLFEVEDETFAAAGSVGLWTKADAVTQFDDFTVMPLVR